MEHSERISRINHLLGKTQALFERKLRKQNLLTQHERIELTYAIEDSDLLGIPLSRFLTEERFERACGKTRRGYVRLKNALEWYAERCVEGQWEKVKTVKDLTLMSARDILYTRNAGTRCLYLLRLIMQDAGLSLKDEEGVVWPQTTE